MCGSSLQMCAITENCFRGARRLGHDNDNSNGIGEGNSSNRHGRKRANNEREA